MKAPLFPGSSPERHFAATDLGCEHFIQGPRLTKLMPLRINECYVWHGTHIRTGPLGLGLAHFLFVPLSVELRVPHLLTVFSARLQAEGCKPCQVLQFVLQNPRPRRVIGRFAHCTERL